MNINSRYQIKKSQTEAKPVLKTEPYEEDNPPPYAPVYCPIAQGMQAAVQIQPSNVHDGNNQVQGAGVQGIKGKVPKTDQEVRPKGPLQSPLAPTFPSPVAGRTRAQLLAPLHQMDQRVMNVQGQADIQLLFQYVPFTTTDLLNWKQHYGPLSAKPREVVDLFGTIIKTHNPTWQDLEQLINTLLNGEERERG
ncbi:gag: Gag [Crotalus adamanteus]|uniref:Gag: Gag n=1 Tax=Crotalus adamanteus TaxID=8729 RepID=A0AAW1B0H6_CROAD